MIESREGSSQVCVRSVAAALRDEFLDVYNLSRWERGALRALSSLGAAPVRRIVQLAQRYRGVEPGLAARLRAGELARSHVRLYGDPPSQPRFDAVFVGAPNGGVAHLCNLIGAPFLSQHFVVSFREHCHPDDIHAYFRNGSALARAILAGNPRVAVVNHYDPLHDRWLVGRVNHIRLKLLALPAAYRDFIRAQLKSGGAIVFVNCTMPWSQYRAGTRHTFQVGGLGGASDRDFVEGRPEIVWMQQAERSAHTGGWPPLASGGGWRLDLPVEQQPESEWGALPELGESIAEFAASNGYRFASLAGPHPEWFSTLAYRAWQELYARQGSAPRGVLIEMFTNTQPAAVRRSRLLPLWLPWNCTDSLEFLLRMRPHFPPRLPALFLLLTNFSLTYDLTPWRGWLDALSGFDVRILGQRERLFPSDPVGLWAGGAALERWCAAHPDPVTARMSVEELMGKPPIDTIGGLI